jgi:hypothetical protein
MLNQEVGTRIDSTRASPQSGDRPSRSVMSSLGSIWMPYKVGHLHRARADGDGGDAEHRQHGGRHRANATTAHGLILDNDDFDWILSQTGKR